MIAKLFKQQAVNLIEKKKQEEEMKEESNENGSNMASGLGESSPTRQTETNSPNGKRKLAMKE